MEKRKEKTKEPTCLHCKHFILRQGVDLPYICTLWGIQTNGKQHPSRAVYSSTGSHCPYYASKKSTQQKHSSPTNKPFNSGIDFEV